MERMKKTGFFQPLKWRGFLREIYIYFIDLLCEYRTIGLLLLYGLNANIDNLI